MQNKRGLETQNKRGRRSHTSTPGPVFKFARRVAAVRLLVSACTRSFRFLIFLDASSSSARLKPFDHQMRCRSVNAVSNVNPNFSVQVAFKKGAYVQCWHRDDAAIDNFHEYECS